MSPNAQKLRPFDRWLGAGVLVVVIAAIGMVLYTGQSPRQAPWLHKSVEQFPKASRHTPPRLLGYQQIQLLPLSLRVPRGIAASPDGRVYVAGDSAVLILTPGKLRYSAIKLTGMPRCVAVGKSGAIYVGMEDHIEVFTAAGKRTASWPAPGKHAVITSVAVADDGVWVADAGDRRVFKCNLFGAVVATLGQKDNKHGLPGLQVPSPYLGVAVAANGEVWITNPGLHHLERYSSTGILKEIWGKADSGVEGFCGCCNPTNIALLPDGRMVTSEKGLMRVKVYHPHGALDCVVAGPESFSKVAVGLDIAADKHGQVLVLDPGLRAVRVYVPKVRKHHV